MKIKLYRHLLERFDAAFYKKWGLEYERKHWQKYEEMHLSSMTKKEILKFREAIAPHAEGKNAAFGAKVNLRDIDTWLEVIEKKGAGTTRARTVENFCTILKEYLKDIAGHRIYHIDKDNETFSPYYVAQIDYIPERTTNSGVRVPPHVDMDIIHIEFGGVKKSDITFWPDDCRHKTPPEALALKNFVAETPERRKIYLAEKDRFHKEHILIGKQFLARGVAKTNVDGNDRDDDRMGEIALDRFGDPAHVTMDVFYETDKNQRDRDDYYSTYFWRDLPAWAKSMEDKDEQEELQKAMEEELENKPEIPLHPMVAVFDLRRHLRLRVHISQLEEYIYDRKLGEKLVLPTEHRDLVETLLENRHKFSDIVKGKSQGAIVLCAGSPGTGKTLTSEVYSEVAARPLYTVQCSQLGTSPDSLEDQLLKVFVRAQRWNAILLLDEADVYVSKRGTNLQQNAIVGVFLRTLEYYNGIMFLTTNRADLVDDAIASRCVARIDYTVPPIEDQEKIWAILAANTKATIHEKDLKMILKDHPHLSGRDIKNLLKLAIMVNGGTEKPITAKMIQFVKKFKPTEDISK